jgi:hypothetical protein
MLHSQILSVSTTANAGLTGEDSNNKLTGENTVYMYRFYGLELNRRLVSGHEMVRN